MAIFVILGINMPVLLWLFRLYRSSGEWGIHIIGCLVHIRGFAVNSC
jgi:hypothetical protein